MLANRRFADFGLQRGSTIKELVMEPRLVMAIRDGEAEPVLVSEDDGRVGFELDDGVVFSIDERELRAALEQKAA